MIQDKSTADLQLELADWDSQLRAYKEWKAEGKISPLWFHVCTWTPISVAVAEKRVKDIEALLCQRAADTVTRLHYQDAISVH